MNSMQIKHKNGQDIYEFKNNKALYPNRHKLKE